MDERRGGPAGRVAAGCDARADEGKWVALFDGKTLSGWSTADGTPSTWKVENGEIHGSGPVSHLFSPRGDYKNFRYKAEIKIADKANSGMYFRTEKGPGFPNGYEAQINSTHTDRVRTGSLYNLAKVYDVLVPPDTWFTQEVEAVGDHITIKVNGKHGGRLHRLEGQATARTTTRKGISPSSSTTPRARSGSRTSR